MVEPTNLPNPNPKPVPPQNTTQPQVINIQNNPQDIVQKKDWTTNFSGKTALSALVASVVSLFIFPMTAQITLVIASLGIYAGKKNNLGVKVLVINILTIIISIASTVLKAIFP